MSEASMPLKKLLGFNAVACALVAFLACRSLVRPGYSLTFLAALVFSILIDAFQWKYPRRSVINIASLAVFGAALITVRLDSVVETFMGAVLLMLAVKLLEEKGARDHVQIVILAVATIVCSAVISLRSEFVFYYAAMSYLLGLGLLLCALFARTPDMSVTRGDIRMLLARAFAIWAMMLPICLLLFFAAPRARVALATVRYPRNGSADSGFNDRITHGMIGRIQESDEIAFRAEMPPIAQGDLYWRGLVLNSFTGNEWLPQQYRPQGEDTFSVSGDRVRQHIFLEQGQFRVLFALDKPVAMESEGGGIHHVRDGTYRRFSTRPARQFQYDAISIPSPVMKPSLQNFRRRIYLGLPDDFSPRIRELARHLTDGLSEGDKIRAIQSYLAPPAFSYTLENLPAPENALEDFLLVSKRGNCEYFASSMAVLCRMAGIPARLIAGYRGGVYNASGEYYIVMQKNAHAWVELWDSEEGAWRRYDPTPAGSAGVGEDQEKAFGSFAMFLDLLNYRLSQLVVEYSGEMQLDALERLQAFLLNPGASFEGSLDRLKNTVRSVFFPIAGALFVIGGTVLCVLRLRAARQSREKVLLQQFLAVMKRMGYAKHPSDGLEEFARSIPAAGEGDAADLGALAWRFARAFEEDYFRDRPMKEETILTLREIIGQIGRNRR